MAVMSDRERLWITARKMAGLTQFERDCPLTRDGRMKRYLVPESMEHAQWHALKDEANRILGELMTQRRAA